MARQLQSLCRLDPCTKFNLLQMSISSYNRTRDGQADGRKDGQTDGQQRAVGLLCEGVWWALVDERAWQLVSWSVVSGQWSAGQLGGWSLLLSAWKDIWRLDLGDVQWPVQRLSEGHLLDPFDTCIVLSAVTLYTLCIFITVRSGSFGMNNMPEKVQIGWNGSFGV